MPYVVTETDGTSRGTFEGEPIKAYGQALLTASCLVQAFDRSFRVCKRVDGVLVTIVVVGPPDA